MFLYLRKIRYCHINFRGFHIISSVSVSKPLTKHENNEIFSLRVTAQVICTFIFCWLALKNYTIQSKLRFDRHWRIMHKIIIIYFTNCPTRETNRNWKGKWLLNKRDGWTKCRSGHNCSIFCLLKFTMFLLFFMYFLVSNPRANIMSKVNWKRQFLSILRT